MGLAARANKNLGGFKDLCFFKHGKNGSDSI